MPTPTKGKRLGGSPAHERAILANLATSLFEHGSITTTQTRARRLRPFAERLITKARRGDLHARRQVMQTIRDKDVVHVLFTEIGPRFATRPGGYTRITKVGPRPGDNAPMAVIELVEEPMEETSASGGRQAAAQPAAPAAAAPTATAASTEESAAEPAEEEQPVAEAAPAEEVPAEEATAEEAAEEAGAAETEAEGTDEESGKV